MTPVDADTEDDSAAGLLFTRNRLRSLVEVGTFQQQPSPPAIMPEPGSTEEHLPLENRPSTSSSQVTLSPLRALVRSLTPKKRRKPILVKAGVHHREEGQDGERDLHVTFDMPSYSSTDGPGDSTKASRHTLQRLKGCCDRPLVPVSGVLSLIGGMSFGYDLGCTIGMIQPIREKFHLTCAEEQLLMGCMIGGAIIVSICGGQWIDKCGRRRAILITSFMYILGSGLCAIAVTLGTLASGRLLQGFGMSLAVISECIFVSEISPKDKRGFMVGLSELGITIGFVTAFICAYILHGVPESWRIMMALGAIPAAIQMIGTFFFLPPSPREKCMNKFDKESILILDNLRATRNEAMNEFASIRHALVVEDGYGTLSLFKSADNLLFRLLVGISLVVLHQLCGQANVLFYGMIIFEQAGISLQWSSSAALILGIVKVIATVVALSITDKKGRRFLLVLGCILMAGSLLLVGISTLIRPPALPSPCQRNLSSPADDAAILEEIHHGRTTARLVAPQTSAFPINDSISLPPTQSVPFRLSAARTAQLVVNFLALVVYCVGYSLGFGPMTWLVLCELYPPGVKGRAVSFCSLINWTVNLILSMTFLHIMAAFTLGGTFLIFSCLNVFSALYIFLVVPDTEGKSLEKVSYDLRTVRPKQRFDANLLRLCPRLKSRLNNAPNGGLTRGDTTRAAADRRALL